MKRLNIKTILILVIGLTATVAGLCSNNAEIRSGVTALIEIGLTFAMIRTVALLFSMDRSKNG